MKIYWDENPLKTKIFLTEGEKRIYKKFVELNEHKWFETSMHYYIDYSTEDLTAENVKEELEQYVSESNIEENYKGYIYALENDIHLGDCTCIACSCMKCHAEDLLGFNTIRGLGKHEGSKIQGAFRMFDDENSAVSIDEALLSLKNFNPQINEHWKDNEEGWNKHLPRWKKEAENAYKWLNNYKTKAGTVEDISITELVDTQ